MSPQALTSDDLRDAIANREVASLFNRAGVDTIYLGIFDAWGTLRQKRLSPAGAARAFEDGWA
ncbi:MAG TPA: hypothetical protein VGH31_10785, partial [Acidimicrobiales bacterium]